MSQADLNARRLRSGIRDGRDGADGGGADLGRALEAIAALHARFDRLEDMIGAIGAPVYDTGPPPRFADAQSDEEEMAALRARLAELEAGAIVPVVSREERLLAIDATAADLAMRIGAERARREWLRTPPGVRKEWGVMLDRIEPKLAEKLPLTPAELRVLRDCGDYDAWRERLDRHHTLLLEAIQDATVSGDLDALDALERNVAEGWPD